MEESSKRKRTMGGVGMDDSGIPGGAPWEQSLGNPGGSDMYAPPSGLDGKASGVGGVKRFKAGGAKVGSKACNSCYAMQHHRTASTHARA